MITGNKKDIAKLLPYVSQRLGTALQYIAETDFTNVKNGEYHLDGEKVFARVDRYTTEPKDSKKPESHNAYIDVQYLGEGTEKIYYTAKADTHKIIEDYAYRPGSAVFPDRFFAFSESAWKIHKHDSEKYLKKVVDKVL